MRIRSIGKKVQARAVKKSREALASSGITTTLDARIVSRVVSGGDPAGPALVLAPPGGGNIGDQALLEAFCENVAGPITVITRGLDDVVVRDWFGERVVIRALPKLIYGLDRAHRADVAAFAGLAATSSSFSVIGADIMDGRYSLVASVNRAALPFAVRRAGLPARIVGFSWSPKARSVSKRLVAAAAKAGVEVMFRDPISARRAAADGITPVTETADIVFSSSLVDESIADALNPDGAVADAAPVVIVNVSGLISKSSNQTDEYARIVAHLLGRGCTVVLVPHVSTASTDDIAQCRKVFDAVGDDRVVLIETILAPAQIRGLAARATLVVTGRMHLGVMALSSGVPAITLATQGKVEGLMGLFGTPELCIEPAAGFSDDVIALADSMLDDPAAWRQRVLAHRDAVRALAARNFVGLNTPDPVGNGTRA